MCAINGYTWKDDVALTRMNQATKHRGPDGTGVYHDEGISLGHNRLSIIDTSERAHQPMHSASDRFVISYNGELYNFKELKSEFAGYAFKSESDTEVILAAWERWGEEVLTKLNGMFAFALWDRQERELFLARDRSGIKPLYYTITPKGGLIFSSEIKAILTHNVPRKLAHTAFSHYTRLLYTPGEQTLFEGIKRLEAGVCLRYSRDQSISTRHFFLREPQPQLVRSYKEKVERTRSCVESAVQRQLVSDKPVGVYLSGGIDSSAILAAALKVKKNIDTFSIGFNVTGDEEYDKFNADFILARRTAQTLGSTHHEIFLEVHDVIERLEDAAYHLDEPVANPTSIAQLVLAEFAKKRVDVVLSGDGGDELFGGYERYRLSLLASLYRKYLPSLVRISLAYFDKLQKLNTKEGVDRFSLFAFQKDDTISRVVVGGSDAITGNYFEERYFGNNIWPTFEELLMEVDRQAWLVDESLVRTDKFSMAYGLEGRVPFLDNEVIDFTSSLPLKYRLTPFTTKKILKDAFRGYIPDFLFHQPKRGWFSPAAKWLRRPELYAFAKEILSPSYYRETSALFSWVEVENMLEEHYQHRGYHLHMLWMVLVFQLWAREFNIRL